MILLEGLSAKFYLCKKITRWWPHESVSTMPGSVKKKPVKRKQALGRKPSVVRRMVQGDIDAAARILAETGVCQEADLPERLAFLLEQENRLCFIAEVGGALAGVLLATYNGFHIFLSHLAVEEKHQRRGLAKLLHDELCVHAGRFGAKGIITDSWLTATGLYYNLGYRLPGAVFVINRLEQK
jgi:predicted N-acetyltransferase YhbS